jgi:DNA-directed RNA polymerase specialized sigma subunit
MTITKKSNYYFTQEHEDAIIKYALSTDRSVRTKLYVELIQPAFDEMVNKIIFTYKFNTLPNIDDLREECKIWLTTILDKYDTTKGSKAFSYYSVITKNWFIQNVKKTNKEKKREVSIEDAEMEIDEDMGQEDNEYEDTRENSEFWLNLMREISEWEKMDLRENERKVLASIVHIFSNIENIEIFNKKAIYLYIRELTGLNTKQVVSGLSGIKSKYRSFKEEWDNGEI